MALIGVCGVASERKRRTTVKTTGCFLDSGVSQHRRIKFDGCPNLWRNNNIIMILGYYGILLYATLRGVTFWCSTCVEEFGMLSFSCCYPWERSKITYRVKEDMEGGVKILRQCEVKVWQSRQGGRGITHFRIH